MAEPFNGEVHSQALAKELLSCSESAELLAILLTRRTTKSSEITVIGPLSTTRLHPVFVIMSLEPSPGAKKPKSSTEAQRGKATGEDVNSEEPTGGAELDL